MKEAGPVGIGHVPVGPAGEEQRIPGPARVPVDGVGGEDLPVIAAVDPASGGELRLVVDRQPLGDPTRLVLFGKEPRGASEDILQRAPHATHPVEVEGVRDFMLAHEPQPVIVRRKRGIGGGGRQEERDPGRGKDAGQSIGAVEVIAHRDVDGAAGRMELPRQEAVGPFRFARLTQRDAPVDGSEVNTEVRSVEGAPSA